MSALSPFALNGKSKLSLDFILHDRLRHYAFALDIGPSLFKLVLGYVRLPSRDDLETFQLMIIPKTEESRPKNRFD